MDILEEHPNYAGKIATWDMIACLREGTDAMRRAGELYLPRYPAESEPAWQDRLKRSFLFAALRDTLDRHAGKPFGQPVEIAGLENIAALAPLVENADGEGQSITGLAKAIWLDAEAFGLSHVFVDMPAINAETRAEELAAGISPRLIHISARSLYYWRHQRDGAGLMRLVEARWKSGGVVTRWTLDSWERYERNDGGQWLVTERGDNTFGQIPLLTCYFQREALMDARPPLKALAELNLKHWQDSSDQGSIERVARCGVFFLKGFREDEAKNLSIGPKALIVASATDADAKVVEHSGSAVGIGREAIKHLEMQMETLGLKPELSRSIDSTATGAVINEAQASTDLQAWALEIQTFLSRVITMAAAVSGSELPDDFAVKVYRDFVVAGRTQDMQTIVQMGASQLLSAEAAQREAMRRGVLDSSHDPEADVAKIGAAGLAGMPAL